MKQVSLSDAVEQPHPTGRRRPDPVRSQPVDGGGPRDGPSVLGDRRRLHPHHGQPQLSGRPVLPRRHGAQGGDHLLGRHLSHLHAQPGVPEGLRLGRGGGRALVDPHLHPTTGGGRPRSARRRHRLAPGFVDGRQRRLRHRRHPFRNGGAAGPARPRRHPGPRGRGRRRGKRGPVRAPARRGVGGVGGPAGRDRHRGEGGGEPRRARPPDEDPGPPGTGRGGGALRRPSRAGSTPPGSRWIRTARTSPSGPRPAPPPGGTSTPGPATGSSNRPPRGPTSTVWARTVWPGCRPAPTRRPGGPTPRPTRWMPRTTAERLGAGRRLRRPRGAGRGRRPSTPTPSWPVPAWPTWRPGWPWPGPPTPGSGSSSRPSSACGGTTRRRPTPTSSTTGSFPGHHCWPTPPPSWAWWSAVPGPGRWPVWARPRSTGTGISTPPRYPGVPSWWGRGAPTTWPAGPRPAWWCRWPAPNAWSSGWATSPVPGGRMTRIVTDRGVLRRHDGVLRIAAVPSGAGSVAERVQALADVCGWDVETVRAGGGARPRHPR